MVIIILSRLLGFRILYDLCIELIFRALDYYISNDHENAAYETIFYVLSGFSLGLLSGFLFKGGIFYFFPNSTIAQFLHAVPLFSSYEFMPETVIEEPFQELLENSHESESLKDEQQKSNKNNNKIVKYIIIGLAVITFIYSF